MHIPIWKVAGGCLAAALLVSSGFAAQAHDSFWTTAAEPYKGATIRGVSESTPPSNYVSDVLAAQFTQLTGIEIEFETTSWDQMYTKAIKDMEANTGIYDFVYIEQDIIYSYLARDFLVNISDSLEANPALTAPNVDFADFTTFIDYFKNAEGDVFGVPMEAFIKVYLYRKDLFENADAQAAFRATYGYDLAPATTHGQWRDNAEFFTGWCEAQDMDCWGTTVQGHTGHPASTYEVIESIFPTFGVYNWGINMDNYKATVENGGSLNGARAKAALRFWVGLLPYAPPEATSSTWDEVGSSFAGGRAAQGWVYGENASWIAQDGDRSLVLGNVGVALPPVAEGVMNQAEAGDGYIGYFDGGAFGIPHSSKNKEATLLWLQFIAQNEVQPGWAAAGGRITHVATYEAPEVQAADAAADGYFSLMRDQGRLFAGAPPFPFHAPIREVIDPFIHQAIAGQMTVEDALDQAAAAVDAELVNLGYAQ